MINKFGKLYITLGLLLLFTCFAHLTVSSLSLRSDHQMDFEQKRLQIDTGRASFYSSPTEKKSFSKTFIARSFVRFFLPLFT